MSEEEGLISLKKHILRYLGHLFPEMRSVFSREDAGNGDPALFVPMAKRLSGKIAHSLEQGGEKTSVELAALLLSHFPLHKPAILEMVCVLVSGGDLSRAYTLGQFYTQFYVEDKDILVCLATILRGLAAEAADLYALGLLEGATLFDPENKELKNDLVLLKKGLNIPAPKTSAWEKQRSANGIWYVTDCFGFGQGGVNGVTQAKSMTLSSLLRGRIGPDLCFITPLRVNLPEALAEFAVFLADVCGSNGWRWPTWVGTSVKHREVAGVDSDIPEGNGKHFPFPCAEPDCIITEGVRLAAYTYLKELAIPQRYPTVFVHHTSPDQFKDTYTDVDMFPQTVEALRSYDNYVCVSSNVLKEWKQIDGLTDKNWFYIPNCAREEEAQKLLTSDSEDLRGALGLPAKKFIGICLASVQTRKAQDILLSQLHRILHNVPSSLFIFVGPILEEWGGMQILEYARRNFTPDQVQFLGPKRNALEFLYASDCMILPSREEALPLTLLEAMMLGKPCVASDVNGIPELVIHGETGFLFSHDSPGELAKSVIYIGKDPDLAKRLGEAGQKRYKDYFSRKQHATRWREVLEKITS